MDVLCVNVFPMNGQHIVYLHGKRAYIFWCILFLFWKHNHLIAHKI
jgi:hypothetical protein